MEKDDMSVYEALRRKLGIWPTSVPKSPELMEMLRLLFTPEEAELLTSEVFSAPFQDYKTSEEIARCTGNPKAEVEKLMENLAKQNLVFKSRDWKTGDIFYSLLPLTPGIFSMYLHGSSDSEKAEKIAYLFKKSFKDELTMGAGVSNYPWGQVILPEGNLVFIHEILPFEKVSDLIKGAHSISIRPCVCRTQNPCTHPVTTCMAIDEGADFLVSRNMAQYISCEEALQILEETEKAGLVHTSTNTQGGPKFICSCCTCSCLPLRKLTRVENPSAFATSGLVPQVVDDKCVLCGSCIEICPFGALFYQKDRGSEFVSLKAERCVGCGLCAYHCPVGALTLVSSGKQPEQER